MKKLILLSVSLTLAITSVFAQLNVSVNGVPICAGNSVTLIPILSGGAPPYSFSWNTGQVTSSINVTPTNTTTYTLTVIDSNPSTASTQAVVTVYPAPNITATGGTICMGSAIAICASGGIIYSWNTGNPSNCITVNPSITTTYTVTGTDANGCTGTSTCVVVVNSNLTIFTNNPTICNGSCAAIIASGANSYTWDVGSNLNFITVCPTLTTTYTVTGVSFAGCTGSASCVVTVYPLPTITATNVIVCQGECTSLSASGGIAYTWSTGMTGNPIIICPNSTASYYVTGTATGCTNTASCMVVVNQHPIVTANNASVCFGDMAILTAGGASTYTWSVLGTGNPKTVSPTVTTTYTVTGTDANGCTGSAFCVVTVSEPINITIPGKTICNGQMALICATNINTTFTWDTGANTSCIQVSPSFTTTYIVSVTFITGCTGIEHTVVNVDYGGYFTIYSSQDTICAGNCSSLEISGGDGLYSWSTGQTSNSFQHITVCPTVTTTYTATNSCSLNTSYKVIMVNPEPIITANGGTITQGGAITLCASGLEQSGGTYQWSAGGGKCITVAPTVNTTYCVTGTDLNGCTNFACSIVNVTNGVKEINDKNIAFEIFPNPFNTQAQITYSLSESSNVKLEAFNILGEKVSTIINSRQNAGNYKYCFSTKDIGSSKGVYFIKLQVNDKVAYKKVVEM
ncbi:MAG: T9SS type A sorting domain-containing protein [Bacteroidales bacterium]|jgi:hypothetical protein